MPLQQQPRAAATGIVSMSTRPDPERSGTVEIATRRCSQEVYSLDLRPKLPNRSRYTEVFTVVVLVAEVKTRGKRYPGTIFECMKCPDSNILGDRRVRQEIFLMKSVQIRIFQATDQSGKRYWRAGWPGVLKRQIFFSPALFYFLCVRPWVVRETTYDASSYSRTVHTSDRTLSRSSRS